MLVAVALAPGTVVRAPQPIYSLRGAIHFSALPAPKVSAGPFTLEQVWEISGDSTILGGYSALLMLDGDRFVAGSDGGLRLEFSRPDKGEPKARLAVLGPPMSQDKFVRDLESLTRDPARKTTWGAYEMVNSIARFGPDLTMQARVQPVAMRDWGDNSGPEAFARLSDGRFLAIEERAVGQDGARHRAVLFAGDPTEGNPGQRIDVQGIAGYRPVDLLPLDGSRALVLFRDLQFGWLPRFATAIGMLDADERIGDGAIRVHELARFAAPFPFENYEGMALTTDGGRRHIWLISDNNRMHYQRTLLVKLRWDERQKARE